MELNEINLNPVLEGIGDKMSMQIRNTFLPMAEMLEEMETEFDNVMSMAEEGINKDVINSASALRKKIKKVRTSTEAVRKKEKAQYLAAGKAIDGTADILKYAVSAKEAKLEEIETYFERIEQDKRDELQSERAVLLKEYVDGAEFLKLWDMTNEVWDAYLNSEKQKHKLKVDAEIKADIEKKRRDDADRKERERLNLENEKLQREREEAEAKEAKAKAEANKLRDEIKRKEEEAKAKAEAKEKIEQDRLNASDSDKVLDLKNSLCELKSKYRFTSKNNQKIFKAVCSLIDKVVDYINKNTKNQ